MDLNNFKKVSSLALEYLTGEEKYDVNKNGEILMMFLDSLGYFGQLVVTSGAYDMYNNLTFDYALKLSEDNDSSDRLYVKLISFEDDINSFKDVIEATIVTQTMLEGKERYYIITNGYLYKIYSNIALNSQLINLKEEGTINITNLTQNDLYLLQKISLSGMTGQINLNTKSNDFIYENDSEEPDEEVENESPTKIEVKQKEKKEFKLPEMDEKTKNLIKKILLGILALIILFLVFKFLTTTENPTSVQNQKEPSEMQQNTQNTQNTQKNPLIDLSPNNISTENYLNISAILDLAVSSTDELHMKLISNLEKDTIVKVGIFCGDNSQYIYEKINDSGIFEEKFQIPATWGEQKVTVGVYLKFNEDGYTQPKTTTDKYGMNGEYISWNTEYSKDMITYSEINHSNTLVETLLREEAAKRERELLNSIEKDFSSIDSRVDAFGNIKHVPKGYSFDETNISENTNIYPMIYYDKASNTSYFYMIYGYVGTQFIRFEKVGFSCDGYNWSYNNGTNQKKDKIVGNKKAEWIYFNNVDTPALLPDMELVAASSETKLFLTGSVNANFNISTEQKAIIKQFLSIYEKYYGNGTFVPNISWFQNSGTKISLEYIKQPKEMRQRGSAEIISLNTLQNGITQKRLNNEIVLEEDEKLLEIMKKTFRPISDTVNKKIYESIINSTPIAIYYDDYETNKNFFKIYFYYDKHGDIENGYIPYINIYTDYTVIVPIQTISATTTGYDKVYAQYAISETLYNELKTYFVNTKYIQYN